MAPLHWIKYLGSKSEANAVFALLTRFSTTRVTLVAIIYSIAGNTFTAMGILWSRIFLFLTFLCLFWRFFFPCLFQFFLLVFYCQCGISLSTFLGIYMVIVGNTNIMTFDTIQIYLTKILLYKASLFLSDVYTVSMIPLLTLVTSTVEK